MLCQMIRDGDRWRCTVCQLPTRVAHDRPPLRRCTGDAHASHRTSSTPRQANRQTPCPHRRQPDASVDHVDVERHILQIPYHAVSKTIAAVACYFNPHRSRSRKQALCPFVRQLDPLGLDLYTIEGSLDARWDIPYGPTANRVHIDLAAAMFHKEALVNIAITRLPDKYEKVLWIDSDVIMLAHDYVDQLTDALTKHRVVHAFSELQYLGPRNEPQTGWRSGVGYRNWQQGTKSANPHQAYPGLAWAADRQLLAEIGGLYDRCITGGGDVAWSCAVYGDNHVPYTKHWSPALIADVLAYSSRVYPLVPSVGYVQARGVHLYHGRLSSRRYVERNQMLGREQFDPHRDLTYAANGTLRWSDQASPALIASVADYIHGRKEDER